MKKFCLILIAAALLTGGLTGCDFLVGPDEPVGDGGGNLVISFGKGDARAVTSGADLPQDVLAVLHYELNLIGPGNEILTRTVANGENIKLTVALGVWRIDVRAYKEDGLAGTTSVNLTVVPGVNAISVPMKINGGYFDIILPETDNGTVQSSFDAAFPETTITLTVTPDEGYVLKSGTLAYNDSPLAGDGPTYTFAMPASNVTVSAEFEPLSYSVTVDSAISNGAVSADSESAVAGTAITLTVMPEPGYALKDGALKYNDGSDHAIAGPPYTFAMPSSDVSVSAEFEPLPPDTYSVTVGLFTGGTVTADPVSAVAGTPITLTATPATGYVLKSGSLKYNDNVISGPSYTFTMPSSHVTVSAEFEPLSYSVTVDSAISNGTVTADPVSAVAGTTITLTATPDTGYALKSGSLKYNNNVISGSPYTFTMPAANVTVSAEFEPLSYSVTVDSAISNGTVTADPVSAVAGTTITLTATPATGYVLKSGSLKYNNNVISGPSYTFTMPAANVTVSAEFEPKSYSVTVDSAISNGTVSPDKTNAVAGTAITLTITPDTGYVLKSGSLKYNNNVISGPSYTFTMPSSDVTVSAEFERLYNVTVGSITGGTVTANLVSAVEGTTITLTATPDTGYVLKSGSLKYNDGSDHAIAGPVYTFTMPSSDVTVSAFFNTVVGPITIEGPRDEAVTVTVLHIDGTSSTEISWLSDESVTFTVDDPVYTGAAGNLRWFVNGEEKLGDGNSLTINARDYIKRKYSLTVMIKLNNQWYSTDTSFTVVD